MKHVVYLFVIFSLSFNSCADKDEPKSAYDSQRILECHNGKTWGPEQVTNKIIGQWEWKHADYIYSIPDNDFKGMKIEFREDFTGTLTYSKVAPSEFTWSIGSYNVYFSFTTDPFIPQLNGQVLFCDDIMLCGVAGSGLADGVNNYFQKID